MTLQKKRCLLCSKDKTVDKYPENRMKAKRDYDLGMCRVCYDCEIKRTKSNMKCVKYNFETRKFEIVYFKTKKEVFDFYGKQII